VLLARESERVVALLELTLVGRHGPCGRLMSAGIVDRIHELVE
jgi:hypothetical protein